MTELRALYSDTWGDIFDRPQDGCVEIRWHDTTSRLTKNAFHGFLEIFAGHVEACGRPCCLIDAVRFKMAMSEMDGAWRDANIIPRYNAAGVAKFAFLMPDGMPAIGADPAPEGPARYPTAYFGTRDEALAWLKD
jgi:hypothetical protein